MSWIKTHGLTIARYKGDLPYCLALANVKFESGGNPKNVTLGAGFYEVGFHQTNLGTPKKPSKECRELYEEKFKKPSDDQFKCVLDFIIGSANNSAWVGGRYFNKRLKHIKSEYPEIFKDEKADRLLWWLTRYGFAIGEYGSLFVFRAAIKHGQADTMGKFYQFCLRDDVADLVPGEGRWQRGIGRWAKTNEKVFKTAETWANRWGLPMFPTAISADAPELYQPYFNTWESVQKALIEQGYEFPKFGADGWYGAETMKAIQQFQEKHDLEPTGELDKNTENKIIGQIKVRLPEPSPKLSKKKSKSKSKKKKKTK
jgi:hypothetical protein